MDAIVRPCALVTSDPFALNLARQYDFEIIPDPANSGETGAIEMATRLCVARGVDSTLVIPADIPLIQASELDQIFDAARGRVRCWLQPPTAAEPTRYFAVPPIYFPLRFGNDSFKPHLAAAQATGNLTRFCNCPASQLDVDNPEDLQQLLAHPGETRTQSLIRRWAQDESLACAEGGRAGEQATTAARRKAAGVRPRARKKSNPLTANYA